MIISESVKSKMTNLEKCEGDFLSSLKDAANFGFDEELTQLLETNADNSHESLIDENAAGNVAMCFFPNIKIIDYGLDQSINLIEKISDKSNSNKSEDRNILNVLLNEMKSTSESSKINETENEIINSNSNKEELIIKNDNRESLIENRGQLIREVAMTKNGNKDINMQEIVSEIKNLDIENSDTRSTANNTREIDRVDHNKSQNDLNLQSQNTPVQDVTSENQITSMSEIISKNDKKQSPRISVDNEDVINVGVADNGILSNEKANSSKPASVENILNNGYRIEESEYEGEDKIYLNMLYESQGTENIEENKFPKIKELSGSDLQLFESKKVIEFNIDKIYESEIFYESTELTNSENNVKFNIEPVKILENDVFEKSLIHSIKHTYENNSVNEITIKLKPDEYGAMTIKLNNNNGNISAKITTDNIFMESLLNNYSSQIIEKLSQQGIEIHEINVLLSGNGNYFGNDTNHRNHNENEGNERIYLSEKRVDKNFLTGKIKSLVRNEDGLNILA